MTLRGGRPRRARYILLDQNDIVFVVQEKNSSGRGDGCCHCRLANGLDGASFEYLQQQDSFRWPRKTEKRYECVDEQSSEDPTFKYKL